MPDKTLTGPQFRARHNKSLNPAQSREAARIVNAMEKAGKPTSVAFAVANARAEGRPRHDLRHPTTGRFVPARTGRRFAGMGGTLRPTQ